MAASNVAAFQAHRAVGDEILAENIGGEGHRAAGVLLLAQPEQIGGETDLGFDLLLAIAVIIVGDDGDHDAGLRRGRPL